MDIVSPSGAGCALKAAMAEIQQGTEDLLKASGFQGMLELENECNMERLRAAQSLLPPSHHAAQLKGAPLLRLEGPDSSFPLEQVLMVKATPRTNLPPSLSINIPQAADNERRGRQCEREDERATEECVDIEIPTNEPFQKQVKFLAPDDDHDEEDGMSEQSSICQSPSWEGYGQRKKEKKLEAERRRREKEQAEKDVKAAKKRNTARLSKAPPPPATATRTSRLVGLMAADRSMSDSLLFSRHLLQNTQPIQRPEEAGRATSVDDLQQTRLHRPAATELPSGSGDKSRRAGSSATDSPPPSAIPQHLLCDGDLASTNDLRRTTLEALDFVTPQSSPAIAPRHGSRSPRDAAFPPSASRTPRLRHMSPSTSSRSSGMLQVTAGANRSQESLSASSTADGPRRNGYVVHQRALAAEWAMEGLADELAGSVGQYYPPSRSSSGQNQHTRRSSLTQEAKSVARRLVGMKTPSSGKDSATQADYLTFKAIPYSGVGTDASASVASIRTLPRNVDGEDGPSTSEPAILHRNTEQHEASTALEQPAAPQSSLSSSGPSITASVPGNQSKKARSLKDAAKAALTMSKGSHKGTDTSTPTTSVPPFSALRARFHSRTPVQTENTASRAAEAACDLDFVSTSVRMSIKPKEMDALEPYRASEGSSSSSAFEDGSPLPSPTTTPDTSRPQSAKDLPFAASDFTKANIARSLGLQDDERTLRQSLDSSKSSTPRIGDSVLRESIRAGNEDRWSRTAWSMDIDCDAQSFMTTVSHFDNADTEQLSPSNRPSTPTGAGKPKALKPASKSSTRSGGPEPAFSIPPRSWKRSQAMPTGLPTVPSPSKDERHGGMVTEHAALGVSVEHRETPSIGESMMFGALSGYARPFQQSEKKQLGMGVSEGHKKRHRGKSTKPPRHGNALEVREQVEEETARVTAQKGRQREQMPGLIPVASSAGSASSPHALSHESQIANNACFANFSEPFKLEPFKPHGILRDIATSTGPPSPVSLPSPLHPVPPNFPTQPWANSASSPRGTSRTSTPSAPRSPGTLPPVSILKQPNSNPTSDHRPQVPSALPKHMQLQTGAPTTLSLGETRTAPMAKMLVECCSCRYYHDMPSKIYECVAQPDAVIEDRLLGISGAITTMVKCPWCQHNMSRNCCAGYAAMVYLKERLH
ncbi:hypothetical protein N658DRAFT_462607 [Parathielavia hyrcaniae]|uniref:Uncharacterized protein n=1 Tax=Parathielavia hyrcaniae TaxID=113614 RepID=A0AAN6Q851_9PEZI|nr:hypothetical protein N658DRAFT_462607 [Parathielavia hyrcaniae]